MSRAGSQVMKMGRRGGRGVEEVGWGGGEPGGKVEGMGGEGEEERAVDGEEEGGGGGETRSIIRAILSSSSGQISGQCVNPK